MLWVKRKTVDTINIIYSLFQTVLTDFVLELGLNGVNKWLGHHQVVPRPDWIPLLHNLSEFSLPHIHPVIIYSAFTSVLNDRNMNEESYFRGTRLMIIK